ncbi:hypothetical protein [Flavihumibacter petaseus]|uniref:Uncharacterized protein n=1 Tax=Flavihumibacter petaseus NBRC 106054 TaxID=1220578 RepID=A0A0E9N169_9BACT|nr:hypothetical protein [Flavihumibacter petaseus]GAO43381.1 hypothetical protein FPE01S_02_04860 [Flavihumibacter petaseus NBRC 106054]
MAVDRDRSSIIATFSGKVGNMLLKRYADKIVISKIPNMDDRVLSEKQLKSNELMYEAIQFAKGAIDDPIRKMLLAHKFKIPVGKVYHRMVKEYMLCKGDDAHLQQLVELPEVPGYNQQQ